MLRRVERKLNEVQTWIDSVASVSDWPAAAALALLRTRAAGSSGLLARASRRLLPDVWVRPAALHGMGVRIDPRNLGQFSIYQEIFIDRIYDLDRVTFPPDTIIDCGAFEGYFTLLAHARFPDARLIAFEPNAANHQRLRANMRDNRVTIDARAAAVSTSDGVAAFSGTGCGGSLRAGEDSIVVDTNDLRRVIAELHSTQLVIKLDIEGGEATLLPALIPVLPERCAIFFEWHQGRETFQGIADQLGARGLVTSITRHSHFDGSTFIDAFAQRA